MILIGSGTNEKRTISYRDRSSDETCPPRKWYLRVDFSCPALRGWVVGALLVVGYVAAAAPPPLFAYADPKGNNLAVFITGLPGNHKFREDRDIALGLMREVLLANGYHQEQLVKFSESADSAAGWGKEAIAGKEQLEQFMKEAAHSATPYDDCFIFVVGHANGRDEKAMFHLPGPDVSYETLMGWIDAIPAKHLMLIVAAPQGQVWIQKLSRPNRVLVVGNGLREFDFIPTLFLHLFPQGFLPQVPADPEQEPVTQISLRDVFLKAQVETQNWYRENHLHPTEMAFLDADGDGKGESLFPEPVDLGNKNLPDAKIVQEIIFKIPGKANS